ncbi:hypothetical protein LINPERPRIM_LOCUS6544 [Linum perenne]
MEGTRVCQMEDSILALLQKLVEPKLPAKSASRLSFIPCQSDEEVIAKQQIHAVALLYNYYHRRQHQELKFVNFESLCKLVVILKPSVLSYMKLTQGSNDTQLVNQEKQLSLTEKKIVDACNIALSLDASKVTPTVHESAVSKVAVLLVDSVKQNALLQFGSVTEGVWSVIEKEVEVCNLTEEKSSNSMDSGKRRRVLKGPSKREGSITEDVLKKTATLAVNEATGISQDELVFLESHTVYSTSKENTATRFYILQCTKADSDTVPHVPIKDLIKSLQGPLFSRTSSQWATTPVVDYFHLLPYARILANWSNSVSNYSENSESPKSNNLSRLLMHKDENVSTETTKQNDSDESSMIGLPNLSDGSHTMELDTKPVTKLQNEDTCTNVANGIKPANQLTESPVHNRSSSGLITSDKAKVTNTQMLPSTIGSKGGNVIRSDENCQSLSVDPDLVPVIHRPVVTYSSNDQDIEKMLSVIASKDKKLSEASLKVLLGKRDKLSFQQRDIGDQIAEYDKKIQTILDGGDDMALNIVSFLEVCEDTSILRSVSREYQSPVQNSGNKRMLGLNGDDLCRLSSCQALDNLCCERNWILPAYHVESVNGGFMASVIVKGEKLEWSATGSELAVNPTMARESAAEKILEKICNSTTAQ